MKLDCILLSLFFVLSTLSTAQPNLDNASSDERITQARNLAQHYLQKNNYPGIAVAVWQNGELIWSEGFGYSKIAEGVPVDPAESLFRIGSVSKTLTAAALAKLVERGLIDLDAPVQTYVPGFPEKQWPVTTRQVARHIAGIRHYNGLEFYSNVNYTSVQDAITVFKNDSLLFEPGSKYSYSSYGWNLISAVIEGASGKNFLEFMHEEIFTPCGMTNTHPDDINLTELSRVTFYNELSGENIVAPQVDNSIKWAGGGFLSTAEDLIRFGEAVLAERITKQTTTNEFWTVGTLNNGQETNYGLGWSTNTDKKDRRWVGHSGGSVGGSTMFLVYPQEQLIVVTLINRSDARAPDLAFTLAEQFLYD